MRAIAIGDCKRKLPVCFFSFLFFGILYVWFGVGIYPDSETYLNMVAEREPLYPLFLHLCRNTELAAVLQNVLAACSVAYFTCTMRKLFLEHLPKRWQPICTFVLWGCALMPHLMTPLGSASHMVLSNAILTEGLTYPLYLFFSTELIRGVLEIEWRTKGTALLRALLHVFLLLLLRNQMLTTLMIWIIVAGYVAVVQKTSVKKKICRCAGILLIVAVVITVKGLCFDAYYDQYCNGYNGSELGNVGFLANTLYLADNTKDVIMENQELSDAYQKMLVARNSEQLFYVAKRDPLARALHYEDCYDPLKFDVIQPVLERKLYDAGVTKQRVNAEVYHQCGELFRALLPGTIGDYIRLFFDNLCLGLIRTVSLPRGIFVAFGILIYVTLMGLLLWKQMRKRWLAVRLLMVLSLGMTLLHVAATSAVIMCLSRYVIYNTTLLYSAGFLALMEEIQILWERKKHGI